MSSVRAVPPNRRLSAFGPLVAALSIAATAEAQPARQECVVQSAEAHLPTIRVRGGDGPGFEVGVSGVSVAARPTRDPDAIAVHVEGAFAFDGVVEDLPLRPRSSLVDRTGLVTLGTSARLTRPRATAHGLVARAELADGVVISALAVPCEELAFDSSARWLSLPVGWSDSEPVVLSRSPRLLLHRSASGGPALEIRLNSPSLLPLVPIGQRGDRFFVESLPFAEDEGSVRGWVDRSSVRHVTHGMGFGRTGGSGAPSCLPPSRSGGSGVWQGSATIASGTTVFRSRGEGAWAEVREPGPYLVVTWQRSPWAKVLLAPNIGPCELHHAWVPRAAVTPADGPTP